MRLSPFFLLAVAACAHDAPTQKPQPEPAQAAKPAALPAPKKDPLAEDVTLIARQLALYLRAQDDALWALWTSGTPFDAEALRVRFPALFRADAVLTVRQARGQPGAEGRALTHLEAALVGLQISAAAATSETALANLEASLTYNAEGKDLLWRDLMRQLANEPSALKRKSLWAGSHRSAERLGALIDARDAAVLKAHKSLSLEPDTFSEARLELDLDAVADLAESVLARTDAEWKAVLERRVKHELRLPLDRISRADVPRLMRHEARIDAAFPREQQAARARALVEALGLHQAPGLDLALDEKRVKGVLPLAILPAPFDARLAVRPRAGLRQQGAMLEELGRVAGLYGGSAQRFENARLGAPILADVTGALFESLLGQPAWLTAQQLSPELAQASARAFLDTQLFDARRNAALVIATLSAHELGPTEAQEQWRSAISRALGVAVPAEEIARWKLELDSGLLPAHHLRVRALAAWLSTRLAADHGPTWWTNPSAVATLKALWSSGTAAHIEERLPPLSTVADAFVASLTGQPASLGHAGAFNPSTFPPVVSDGGQWAPVAWGIPPPPLPPKQRPAPAAALDGGRAPAPDAGALLPAGADAGPTLTPDAGR